jgi:hypothetical protein
MYQFDAESHRQWHLDHVAALKADYVRAQRLKPEPRVVRMNRSFRLAWVSSLSMRAAWLVAVMVPIAVVAVGIKELAS